MGIRSVANNPCHCGSGKKYKKCCLDMDSLARRSLPKSVLDDFAKEKHEKLLLEGAGIKMNYVNPIIFKGKKVWAIGSTVYHSRPPDETFHEFILFVLRNTLGRDWWEMQIKTDKKHFIMKCFLCFQDWKKRNSANGISKVGENLWVGTPDGWSKALLSLAFDVCSLIHAQKLPKCLLNRLRNEEEYQGARYEIAVAAVFARLGYDVHFLDEDREVKTEKHCDFIATTKDEKISIAIEVKSKRRKGVIHHKGELDELKALKGDIGQLLNQAKEQNPGDRPFMIFIDINSPLTPDKDMKEKQWFKDIWKNFSKTEKPTVESPDSFNAVFFTNFSFHYQTEKEADPGEHLSVISQCAKFSLPESYCLEIDNALSHYGYVPNIDIAK